MAVLASGFTRGVATGWERDQHGMVRFLSMSTGNIRIIDVSAPAVFLRL